MSQLYCIIKDTNEPEPYVRIYYYTDTSETFDALPSKAKCWKRYPLASKKLAALKRMGHTGLKIKAFHQVTETTND
jgi:hypothetical protein